MTNNLEDRISAFSMWEVLKETIIPGLLNMEYSESTFLKLRTIVKDKEFVNIFVCSHNPTLSYEEHQAISKKYKTFTVWLLGRFFYFLSSDKLSRMHNLIIDVQWRILFHLCIRQPQDYEALSKEYLSALKLLNDYHKELNNGVTDAKMVLNAFIPCEDAELQAALNLSSLPIEVTCKNDCDNLLQNLIKLVGKIVNQNIEFNYFNGVTYNTMNCFLYILAECNLSLKLDVLDIYMGLLRQYTSSNMPFKFANKFNSFVDYIEPFIYDVYNKKVDLNKADMAKFESILTIFFNYTENLEETDRFKRLAVFIIGQKVDGGLLEACCELISKTQELSWFEQANLIDTDAYSMGKIVQQRIILEIKSYIVANGKCSLNLHASEKISLSWTKLHRKFKQKLLKRCGKEKCYYVNSLTSMQNILEIVTQIQIEIRNINDKNVLEFVSEHDIVNCVLDVLNSHVEGCGVLIAGDEANLSLQRIFTLIPLTCKFRNVDFIFDLVAFPFLREAHERIRNSNEFPNARRLITFLGKQTFSRESCVKCLNKFLFYLAFEFTILRDDDDRKIQIIQKGYWKIARMMLDGNFDAVSGESLKWLLSYSSIFNNQNDWIIEVLLPALDKCSGDAKIAALSTVSDTICKFYSPVVPVLSWNAKERDLEIDLYCLTCTKALREVQDYTKILAEHYKTAAVVLEASPGINGNREAFVGIVNRVIDMFRNDSPRIRMELMKSLNSLTHVELFHSATVTKLWVKLANDEDESVRMEFARTCSTLLENIWATPILDSEKEITLNILFDELMVYAKNSLQYSNFALQDTVLETLRNVSILKFNKIIVKTAELLLYFIMIPTSKYSLVAANIFIQMASHHNTTTNLIYSQYKKELSQSIVELCAINQGLIDYNLNTSLQKISLILGFFGPKDFIAQESHHLLPFFVSLLIKMPKVETLVREIAELVDTTLPELLSSRFGNIFLHLFLNESDEGFKKSIKYVEKITGLSGSTLRKGYFQVILNKLLLHFYDKRDRVLLAIRILAHEDSESKVLSIAQIPDYIQPKLLGVLAYFDGKLILHHISKKQVLSSLAELLRFMGAKHITPLRFKILAMLRTASNSSYENFLELNGDVWDAFVRSCEIDALGPQLASIFVFLLPLMHNYSYKIQGIFQYLIIENEMIIKDYIPDLFFVLESSVNEEICLVIKKYLERIENKSFKEQLKWCLKYLNHETIDIRVHGMKYLKRLMEKNREELDQMILGYNGIDSTIVELLDILMLGCRDKDATLKLSCGDCIGQLGAIEPSHLPRRYTQQTKTFVFYITEDAFIVNALNELTRALHAEKNTQRMNRFSLAIQEILKTHGISLDINSPKHILWNNFSDAQRELMLPLLSSRYTMVQPVENISVSPIYGSKFGATFQTWVYNWTANLVLTTKPDKRGLLQVCLLSLKQDHRMLMNFLPHILLHALLDNADVHQRVYDEIMAVVNSFNNRQQLKPNILNVWPKPLSNVSQFDEPITTEELIENQCTAVIFVLLDFLERCVREWMWKNGEFVVNDSEYQTIKGFLSRFCKLQLARCNYQCGEYPRALMYLEDYIKGNPDALSAQLVFLAETYAQLSEPDGVAGVTALQDTEPPLEQRLLALEVSGKLADATACYERIHPPLKPYHIQGLVQCYLDLDNVNTALNFAKGAVERQPEYKSILLEIQAEPLWRLSRYSELNDLLQQPELKTNKNWGVEMGRALINFRDGRRDEFKTVLDGLRITQVESLGVASLEEGAYQHGYSFIAKLHAINELQQVESMVYDLFARPNDQQVSENLIKKLTAEWELRFKVVQESIRIQEPILCLRRVALEQAKQILSDKVPNSIPLLNSLLGESWLLSATIARSAGVHQQAYTYALKAEEYAPPSLFLEKAQLHWLREEHEQALTTLRRGLEGLMPEGLATPSSSFDKLTLAERKIVAEAKLLIASYNESISNVDMDINKQHYREAFEVYKQWEKSLLCLAQYYDRIFETTYGGQRDTSDSDTQLIYIMTYFCKSLQYGTRFVYQSMPRLLSIWFDYGTRLLEYNITVDKVYKEERSKTLIKMTKVIDSFLDRLPTYIFLTAFSQLVSRICHPQKQVCKQIKSIIIKIILQYPQQSLWMIMSVVKSSYPVRTKRCMEILNDSLLKTTGMIKLIDDFTKLAEKLIELCNKEIPPTTQCTSVSALLRSLPRLLTKGDFSEIMIPTQKFRKLVLPNPDFQSSQHNPFPNHYVHIVGIEDEITVLQSLQRPRKITFRGSDGKLYVQMLKPKDDLRKDFRLMEFNDIVNQLLSREPDSRQRRLNIRLYSVVPLNEECGILEWVPNLIGLRPVLMELYKQIGKGMKGRELKRHCCHPKDPLGKKKEIFTKILLPNFPPVFGEWFRKSFPDAQGWLTARTAYIRTTAVISMVGYIVGLGDRHGENILFDSTSGDTVHVDFNCLFNKGEQFEWAERVPFRLTHNMVDAMGPLGVEGTFRKSCACTLRVLRAHSTMLMSIVTPFVYDPLVQWAKNTLANANAQTNERTNEQAVEHVRNIELRLQGMVRTKGRSSTIALSVEGQTNNLIQEAISIDNLCQMYFGWGPYM